MECRVGGYGVELGLVVGGWELKFRVQGLGFGGAWNFQVWGSRLRVNRVEGCGSGGYGSWCKVWGLGLRGEGEPA